MTDASAGGFGALVIIVGFVFGVVLLVVWIVLPFAVLGIKHLLRELVREQQRTNQLLQALELERRLPAPTAPAHPPPAPK